MTDSATREFAHRWLKTLASSDFAAWPTLVADDVRMRFPFAPPPFPDAVEGREACEALIRGFFAGIESFEWHDVEIHPGAEPGLAFVTARSDVRLKNGRSYRNEYCFMIRTRDGRLAEYREYFNPLPAIAAFGPG